MDSNFKIIAICVQPRETPQEIINLAIINGLAFKGTEATTSERGRKIPALKFEGPFQKLESFLKILDRVRKTREKMKRLTKTKDEKNRTG